MNQAKALGISLSKTPFIAIHASPLKRALWTAEAIRDAQKEPQPPLTTSPLLREQHFGIAEGKPWIMEMESGVSLEKYYARGVYPVLPGRVQKFPEGESLDDLAKRAQQAINELAMPYVWQAARAGEKGIQVAIVSHGLCISELLPALLSKDASGVHPGHKYKGLLNTAWTRVTVNVKGSKEGRPLEFSDSNPPPLEIKVTDFNRHEHLERVASTIVIMGNRIADTPGLRLGRRAVSAVRNMTQSSKASVRFSGGRQSRQKRDVAAAML